METVQLNYKVLGQGQALVIIHGLLGSLDNWQTIAKKLAEHYQVYTLDLRNHGKSPHSAVMNYNAMVADIEAFYHQHQLTNTILIGHSMGGKVAMQFALHNPGLVAKLIPVDIAPVKYKPGHIAIFNALRSVNFGLVKSRKEVEQILAEHIKSVGVRLFLMKGLQRTDNGFAWKFNLDALWNNYNTLIGGYETTEQFAKPTLFVKGANSNYIINAYLPLIKSQFPSYKLAEIANAGHWVHAENPKHFLEAMLSFIAE